MLAALSWSKNASVVTVIEIWLELTTSAHATSTISGELATRQKNWVNDILVKRTAVSNRNKGKFYQNEKVANRPIFSLELGLLLAAFCARASQCTVGVKGTCSMEMLAGLDWNKSCTRTCCSLHQLLFSLVITASITTIFIIIVITTTTIIIIARICPDVSAAFVAASRSSFTTRAPCSGFQIPNVFSSLGIKDPKCHVARVLLSCLIIISMFSFLFQGCIVAAATADRCETKKN